MVPKTDYYAPSALGRGPWPLAPGCENLKSRWKSQKSTEISKINENLKNLRKSQKSTKISKINENLKKSMKIAKSNENLKYQRKCQKSAKISKIYENSSLFGACRRVGEVLPRYEKSSFFRVGWSDGLENFAIDSTHQYNMWKQYEHYLTTQTGTASPKSWKTKKIIGFRAVVGGRGCHPPGMKSQDFFG